MTKTVKFTIPDEVFNKANEIASKYGKSVHELAKQLLKAYLEGASPGEIPIKVTSKRFRAKKELKCATCGETIKPGELAYYVEYEYETGNKQYEIHHAGCWEYASDEALAKLYVKKRELKRIIRALEREANRLADAISEAKSREKLIAVVNEIQVLTQSTARKLQDLMKKIENYHIFTGHSIQETWKFLEEMKKTVQEFNAEAGKLALKIEEASVAITLKLRKVSKKARE